VSSFYPNRAIIRYWCLYWNRRRGHNGDNLRLSHSPFAGNCRRGGV